ncbi:MAG TPA: GAF domain-containing protein, partial [Desulfuromonadaceae bacterium]
MGEIDQAIIRGSDRDFLFQDFCRIAVEQGGFILSWVGMVDGESGQVCKVAACGATGYLDDIRISIAEGPEGIGPTGMSLREGTYSVCNDFLNDPCTQPWHEQGRTYGFGASASVALKEEGRVIGALTLYAGEKDFFDQQHVELLVQMGADVSFALDNLAREGRRQTAEQSLRQETLERLRTVEALREKEQLLLQQSRLAAMGEMINNIAHQWRQPLNVLGLLIQQMRLFYDMGSFNSDYLDTSVTKSMGLINHMSQTIDDFRNFFKPDKEKVEFTLHEVVARTLSLVEDGFKSQQIRIDFQANANPAVRGFPNEYSQALLNILMNARDALLDSRPDEARVTVTIAKEGKRAVVTVADNAGGIAEEVMDRIFEPYFTTKGPDRGTGVGLFMSKTIVEKNMGGKLTAYNTAEGAEFRIEL